MNPKVDTYLIDGCGRCPLYQTPQCKVHTWQAELKGLRKLVLECGLHEEYKWSQPCYTYQRSNVLLVSAFKEYAFISFFKGSLLKDPYEILVKPGKSSQASRLIRITSALQIDEMESIIKAYIHKAIELEKKGLKVQFEKNLEPIPEELQKKLDEDPDFRKAFEALTPGRQRGYILHFSQPKQSKTRVARIEKCMSKILKGEGLNDSYKSMKK